MFQGMRILESWSSGGELGVMGSKGCSWRKDTSWFWPVVMWRLRWWGLMGAQAGALSPQSFSLERGASAVELGEAPPFWSQAAASLPWTFSMLHAFTHTTQPHHFHRCKWCKENSTGQKRSVRNCLHVKPFPSRCLPPLPASPSYPWNPDSVCKVYRGAFIQSLGMI